MNTTYAPTTDRAPCLICNTANSAEAVLYCGQRGVGAYLGGTCNETDRSAQLTVHVGLATRPDQMLAKPGMGADEGLMIVRNEMNRALARLRARAGPGQD